MDTNKKRLEVKCLSINPKGMGICEANKKIYEVNNILPKETGLIEILDNQRVRLVKVLKPSSRRVEPVCDMYDKCGGCQILHMNYNDQIEFKKNKVEDCLKQEKLNYKVDEVIEADKFTGYRNKMQVAFKYKDGKVICGFYEEESHRIIPLSNCPIQSDKQNEIVKYIQLLMTQMKITPYNEDKRTGVVRFVLVREARYTKDVMVIIVTNSDIFPGRNDFVKRLKTKFSYITSIIQNINSRKTSIILGEESRVLFGNEYIEDYLCGIKFKISVNTFFQINPYQTEKLYEKVKEYANLSENDVIIDAYCGIGTIGMTLAHSVNRVIAVESVKQSVVNAIKNAKENNIRNIRFYNEDATDFIKRLASDNEHIDVVIMDPPRSGSTVEFLNSVKKLKPHKVVYVSCDPSTLARDLKTLVSDYIITKKAIVDMFVGTYHVESVVRLDRKN